MQVAALQGIIIVLCLGLLHCGCNKRGGLIAQVATNSGFTVLYFWLLFSETFLIIVSLFIADL